MGVVKLSTAGILDYSKTSNFLSGNAPLSLGSFDLLETTTLTSSASSVTFSGLGAYSDYKHLQIRYVAICNSPFDSTAYLRFNGDTTASYSDHTLKGDGSTVTSSGQLNRSYVLINNAFPSSSYSNEFAGGVVDVLDFSSSSKNSTVRVLNGGLGTGRKEMCLSSGAYYKTDAVTSIVIGVGNGIGAGSRFSLMGVK
jgi:hypothetical protein